MDFISIPDNKTYYLHDQYDSQIPATISWIGVLTSHIYLFIAFPFLLCKQLILQRLGVLLIILYTTSIIHWQHPLYQSVGYYADLFMVFVTICYGTYATYYTSKLVFTIWMVCLSICTIIFITNEILYYWQVIIPKNILKSNPDFIYTDTFTNATTTVTNENTESKVIKNTETIGSEIKRYFSLEPTWPRTQAREYAYYRSTITHGIGVHLLTGGVAGVSIGLICLFAYQ